MLEKWSPADGDDAGAFLSRTEQTTVAAGSFRSALDSWGGRQSAADAHDAWALVEHRCKGREIADDADDAWAGVRDAGFRGPARRHWCSRCLGWKVEGRTRMMLLMLSLVIRGDVPGTTEPG